MKTELSIILCAHNEEQYIAEAIKSLHLEKHPEWEAIVIDDASTDKTSTVIRLFEKKFSNCRAQYLDHNTGLGNARNLGILLAKGEYISFLDADDYVDEAILAKKVQQATASAVDILISGHSRVHGSEKSVIAIPKGEYDGKSAAALYLQRSFASWSACFSLYKRAHIQNNACQFTPRYLYEDVMFCFPAMYTAKKVVSEENGYYSYCRNNTSITQKCDTQLHLTSSAKLYSDLATFIKSLPEENEYANSFAAAVHILLREHFPRMLPLILNGTAFASEDIFAQFMHFISCRRSEFADAVIEAVIVTLNSIKKNNSSKEDEEQFARFEQIFRKNIGAYAQEFNTQGTNENFVHEYCYTLIEERQALRYKDTPLDIDVVLSNLGTPLVASTAPESHIEKYNQFLPYLFNATKMIDTNAPNIADADIFTIWGAMKEGKPIVPLVQAAGDKPLFFIEDGFLKSIATLGLDVAPEYISGVCFSVDDLGFYFDATQPSRLELLLNAKELQMDAEQLADARKGMNLLKNNKLTKYNHQPMDIPEQGTPGRKKILVVDQAFNDYSIIKGMANEQSFKDMLTCAIEENPDCDVLVKTHPDLAAGWRKATSYYAGVKRFGRVFPVTIGANPYSLLEQVEKVYVATSQLGFEALIAGKEVHCFGMPFYAGWGATTDRVRLERRSNKRTVEEIFFIVYYQYLKYVDPRTQKRTDFTTAVDYLLDLRCKYFSENA